MSFIEQKNCPVNFAMHRTWSSHQTCSIIGALRNIAKFIGKTCARVSFLPVNFTKFLRTPFFREHLWTTASIKPERVKEAVKKNLNPQPISRLQFNFHCDNFGYINNITRIHWLDRRIVRKQVDFMPTYHYVQNQRKLIIQSRENGQKPQFGQFFWRFQGQISLNCKFF